MVQDAPRLGTVERWAWDYVTSSELTMKLQPPVVPAVWQAESRSVRLERAGRPVELVQRTRRKKAVKPGALHDAQKRAEVLHTFLHHELQAAELMAWALLAFTETPAAFRRGLLGICQDEIRHLQLYQAHLVQLGYPFGSFEINDWFWKRVPVEAATPVQFVARMGVGFEGGNLDHGARFTEYFRAAGDEAAALIQAQITHEEESHAAFALHWFKEFTGGIDFDAWRVMLPAPIGPSMARGLPLNLDARRRAGYPDEFLERLAAWTDP